jgi:hypothetical protein
MNEVVSAQEASAIPLGSAAPFDVPGLVPEQISDAVSCQSVFGPGLTPARPAPNASSAE